MKIAKKYGIGLQVMTANGYYPATQVLSRSEFLKAANDSSVSVLGLYDESELGVLYYANVLGLPYFWPNGGITAFLCHITQQKDSSFPLCFQNVVKCVHDACNMKIAAYAPKQYSGELYPLVSDHLILHSSMEFADMSSLKEKKAKIDIVFLYRTEYFNRDLKEFFRICCELHKPVAIFCNDEIDDFCIKSSAMPSSSLLWKTIMSNLPGKGKMKLSCE